MITCSICCEDDIYEDDVHYKLNCDHLFCDSCIHEYIVRKIDENEMKIQCPCYNCDYYIDDETITTVLNNYDEYRILEVYNNYKKMDAEKVYHMCPECNRMCKKSEDNNSADCSYCYKTFCCVCNCIDDYYHDYNNCPNESDIISNLSELQSAIGADDELIKLCPICKTIIYKETGCLAIKCIYCKTKFCWGCLKTNRTIEKLGYHYCTENNTYQFLTTNSDDEYTDGYNSD